TSKYDPKSEERMFVGYQDRPREFIYSYLEEANISAAKDEKIVEDLRSNFLEVMDFVKKTFPNGFQKPGLAKQIPRARYEAIAIGSALAIKDDPSLLKKVPNVKKWMDGESFIEATTSDGANTKSKLFGRVQY